MIVLDASVVIAHLDLDDAHHDRATELLRGVADESFACSALTIAEILVAPARADALDRAWGAIADLAIQVVPVDGDMARHLAALRAETDLRLPDCCVLAAARSVGARGIATFDAALSRMAVSRGLAVV